MRSRQSDGVPFSMYALGEHAPNLEENVAELPTEAVSNALAMMQKCSATVLEIAATIHWLRFVEQVPDWNTELVRRKGVKTGGGRTEEATRLLGQLGLT
jgi:hypothetical protein